MVSSTDGWIVGADGMYRWQEVTGFSTDYFIIIIAVIVAVIFVVLFFIRNRQHKRTERAVLACWSQEKKGSASDFSTG
jgi:uncharacterized membrane protein YqiK